MAKVTVRPARYADDRWYPSSPEALRAEVSAYIDRAPALDLPGEVIGLTAPHAGYFFSGHVAGASFRQVRGAKYDTVVLVGPDHHGLSLGKLSFADYDAWQSPLGDVPVDQELMSALHERVDLRPIGRDSEHSLEVQLPFLQTALAGFKLVPIMVGDQSADLMCELGVAIADLVRDRHALLVASTDLSHYHPYHVAKELDENTLQYVLKLDAEGLARAVERGAVQACGGGPVAAVLFAARALGAQQAHLVKYANSGDVWEDKSRVVGYAAVALT